MSNWIKEWEVEQCVEARVNAVEAHLAALKERRVNDVSIFNFANYNEVRVFAFDRRGPFVPESIGHILPGVHAYSVETCGPDPPKGVLDQIPRDLWIVLIKIG